MGALMPRVSAINQLRRPTAARARCMLCGDVVSMQCLWGQTSVRQAFSRHLRPLINADDSTRLHSPSLQPLYDAGRQRLQHAARRCIACNFGEASAASPASSSAKTLHQEQKRKVEEGGSDETAPRALNAR